MIRYISFRQIVYLLLCYLKLLELEKNLKITSILLIFMDYIIMYCFCKSKIHNIIFRNSHNNIFMSRYTLILWLALTRGSNVGKEINTLIDKTGLQTDTIVKLKTASLSHFLLYLYFDSSQLYKIFSKQINPIGFWFWLITLKRSYMNRIVALIYSKSISLKNLCLDILYHYRSIVHGWL